MKPKPKPKTALRSAVADMLANGPKTMVSGIMVEEVYEGRPCIVLRDDATMTGKPLRTRPIRPGETAAQARDAFVFEINQAGGEIVVTGTESDDVALTLDDAPGLEKLDEPNI